MDEMDINIENYDELFGMALTHSEELFENGGFNSLFGAKAMSAGDSNCQDAIAAEVLNFCHSLSAIILPFLSFDYCIDLFEFTYLEELMETKQLMTCLGF
jgi:hypothetical protein